MNDLIVGNEGCSFNEIVNTIGQNDQNVLLLAKKWKKFARALKVPASEIFEYEQDILLKQRKVMDVVVHLLVEWRSKFAGEAKLITLLDILEMECGWKDVAECVWKLFQKKMPENITWADLDKRSRNKIMESEVMFGMEAQKRRIKDLCHLLFDDQDIEPLLTAALSGPTILQLLDSNLVSIIHNSMPETPPYYVSRLVSSRRRLNPEIFDQRCSDVFLFQNIDLSDLSSVARSNPIAISSRQTENVTSRFILLDAPKDFEKIAQLTGSKTSVHWLHFKNGNFYWIKSHGSLHLLREYIHHEQDELSEDEFQQVLNEEHKRKLPVCIADVPGMGKTCLLAKLCMERKATCDEKTLVLFVLLPEFLKDVGDFPQELGKDNVCKFVAEHVSQNAFGQEIVSKMLQSDDHQVEIYFDGFDEVPFHQLSFTKCFLECLTEQLAHVRIIVTTRVHKRQELEETLNVLSFSLVPFRNEDQSLFFERYWANCGITVNENLTKLANFLIDTITSRLPSNEFDVVGVPLQCYMLADIYQEDAAKYSNASSVLFAISVNIHSLHDMYRALMAKRFSTCVGDEKNILKRIHVNASISTVLPDLPREFLETNQFSLQRTTDLEKINSLGIVKAEWVGNAIKLQFIHHSYAEFLLADFLVENLFLKEMKDLLEPEHALILFIKAFSLSDEDPNVNTVGVHGEVRSIFEELCQFPEAERIRKEWRKLANSLNIDENKVADTVSFMNTNKSLLNSQSDLFDPTCCVIYLWKINGNPKLSQLLHALRSLDFNEGAESLKQMIARKIFERSSLCFFINTCLFHKQLAATSNSISRFHRLLSKVNPNELPLYLYCLLESCLYHDFASLFTTISRDYLFWLIKNDISKSIPWFPLIPVAARHSSSNLVVECCKFVELMGKCQLSEQFSGIMEHSLINTVQRGDFTIFDYLFKKFEVSAFQREYLLILCCTDSLSQSEHIITEKVEIIRVICKVGKKEDVNIRTLLLSCNKVHLKLLQCMVEQGADLNSVNGDSGSTISHNVALHYPSEQFHLYVLYLIQKNCIKLLSIFNKSKTTPLHFALHKIPLKLETIELISAHLGNCYNRPNSFRKTEFYAAVMGLQKMPVLEAILRHGGDYKILGKDNQTMLHCAAMYGHVEALSYFISLGCSVNARDDNWRTPLHYACKKGERNVDDVVRVLLEHKVNAKCRDLSGSDAITHAETRDILWMLKPDTLDTLRKMSEVTMWDRPALFLYQLIRMFYSVNFSSNC